MKRGVAIVVLMATALVGCGPAPQPPAAEKPARRRDPIPPRTTAAATPAKEPAKCSGKPNFLVIVLDTLRYDASQIDPKSRTPTPFLAKLRQQGVNFSNCYSTSDSTPISHFSILSGYVIGWLSDIDAPEASVAHQLRRHGYRSFGVSANGNLSPASYRLAQGFDRYVCLQDVYEKMGPAEKAAANRHADALIRQYGAEPNDWLRLFVWSSARQVLPRVDRMLEHTPQPFYGFVNFIDVHDPYMPDPRNYSQKSEGVSVADLRFRPLSDELREPDAITDPKRRDFVKAKIHEAAGRAWSTALDLDRAQIGVYRKRYLAEVRQLDRDIQELFAILERRRLLDNTVIVLTSDHGEAFGEDQLMTHSFVSRSVREATNHVPLLVRFPPCYGIEPRQVDDLTSIADIVPTIYDLVGIDWKPLANKGLPGFFGRSLLPYLRSTETRTATVPAANARAGDATWVPPPAEEKKRQDDEAIRRLRSLGYIR